MSGDEVRCGPRAWWDARPGRWNSADGAGFPPLAAAGPEGLRGTREARQALLETTKSEQDDFTWLADACGVFLKNGLVGVSSVAPRRTSSRGIGGYVIFF